MPPFDSDNRGAAGRLARTDSLSVTPIAPAGGSRPSGSQGTSSRGTGSRVEIDLTQTIVAPTDQSLRAVKWIVLAVMLSVAVLIGLRLALVEGLLAGIGRRVRIDGPSMAPALVGEHYRVTCDDCRFPFTANHEDAPKNDLACCPNCGYQNNELRLEDLVLGERVVIDRWPLVRGRPQVGDIVAAVDPRTPGEMVVKRVAGVPGQRLGVRRGDLLADGEVVRKSLAELRKVRVLVHDNRFEPTKNSGLPDRWRSTRAGTDWHPAMFGYWNTQPPENEFDWLEYQHWACVASPRPRTKPSPILDNDSFNQGLSREQHAVPDVQLSCRMRALGKGKFTLAAVDGVKRFETEFNPGEKKVRLLIDGVEAADEDFAVKFDRRPVQFDFGLCDGQVLLTVAGREIFRHPYERPAGHAPETLRPLAIGTSGMSMEVSELKVWRDLYYLDPEDTGADWEAERPLAAGSYALLGDNIPVSIDSRQWSQGVARDSIRGIVYRPFWNSGDPAADQR
jgi:hypothetical protein